MPTEEVGMMCQQLSARCHHRVRWDVTRGPSFDKAWHPPGGPCSFRGIDEICILHCSCICCYMGESPESGIGGCVFPCISIKKRKCGRWGLTSKSEYKEVFSGCFKKKDPSRCSMPQLPCGRFHHMWRGSPGIEGVLI